MLSPFISDPDGPYVAGDPIGPLGTLSPSDSGSAILVDPGGGTLLPGEGGPTSCPGVLTDDLVLVAAVPLPAIRDPMVASSPVEVIVREKNITGHDGWSDPEVVGTPSVVAMVGRNALPMSYDTTLSSVDECTEWDIRDQFETINGMSVYYGGDLCDLDESDWDDPYDIASAEYVEQYNFDVPEGMELMVHVRCRGPYGSDIRENEETGLTHVCQTSLGCTRDELDTVDVDSLAEVFAEELLVTDGFYQGTVSSVEGDFSDPDDGSIEDNEYLGGLVWFCILDCIWRFTVRSGRFAADGCVQ